MSKPTTNKSHWFCKSWTEEYFPFSCIDDRQVAYVTHSKKV